MLKSKLAGKKMAKYIIVIFSFFVLLSCEGDNVPESAVLKGIPYSENTYEERFGQSAFQHLQGKDRDEAVYFLENDGFMCVIYKCLIYTSYRDSTYDVVFGTNPLNRSSILGDRYSFNNTYTINILSKEIESTQDISVEFERIETNE
jgi:hypothetical protein